MSDPADLTMFRLSETKYRIKAYKNLEQTEPLPLDGLDLLFIAKKKVTDADADSVFELTLSNGLEIDGLIPAGNELIVTISTTDTTELSPTKNTTIYGELLAVGANRKTLGTVTIPVKASLKQS
jgi:hypothetical protein